MRKWEYIRDFLFLSFIVSIKTNGTEVYPYSTTTDVLQQTGGIDGKEEVNVEITDDDKIMRIFLVGGAQLRAALRNEAQLWKNGTVPYEIHNTFRKENKDFILNVIEEFHNKTCVRFKPRQGERSYILIMPGSGCSAGLGKGRKANPVKLNKGCFVKGIVIHELMHTLGFIHEQNRPDRDEFVRIDFGNILERTKLNFVKYSENQVNTFNQTYDYESVMHYGAFDFAKDKSKPTIIPLQQEAKIGQRVGFSEMDLMKINLLYNCNGRNNTEDKKERNGGTTGDEKRDESDIKNEKPKRFRLLYLLSKLL